jgi:hypothetical protein
MFFRSAAVLSLGAVLMVASTQGCTAQEGAARSNGAPSRAAADGWTVLFDGTSLDHWRGYRRADVPSGWQIEGDALAFVPGSQGGDLITREQFGDFELELEWRISPGGNSGIFYRGTEDHRSIWQTAPEYQVLDDDRHPDARNRTHRAADLYNLIESNERKALSPVGEWNRTRIVARGNHVEHWLNDEKVVEFQKGTDEWRQMVAASKFASIPDFARFDRGHIGLQDHGDRVWYRNIRIRTLDAAQR